jgi:hypothetical protein
MSFRIRINYDFTYSNLLLLLLFLWKVNEQIIPYGIVACIPKYTSILFISNEYNFSHKMKRKFKMKCKISLVKRDLSYWYCMLLFLIPQISLMFLFSSVSLSLWLYSPLDLGRFFRFLIYIQSVGLLGRGISPSQGCYLHAEQHKRRIKAHRHSFLEWDSNLRSQCSSGRRRFLLETVRPLWSAPNVSSDAKIMDSASRIMEFCFCSSVSLKSTPWVHAYLAREKDLPRTYKYLGSENSWIRLP